MKRLPLLTAVMILATASAVRADTRDLDAELKNQAGKILAHAQGHGIKNIAVLKFLVRTGDAPFGDNVGPLNIGLSNRLTVALILELPDERIGVIANANEVLAKEKANHLDEDLRAACFDPAGFVLAWGSPAMHVKPDLFVTGRATLSKDLEHMTLEFQAFGKDGKLESLGEVKDIPISVRTLVDSGHSFLLTPKTHPDLFRGGRGVPAEAKRKEYSKASQMNKAVLNDPRPAPAVDIPVRVTVFYDDRPVPFEGSLFDPHVREPNEGERIKFRLENLTDDMCGVVLKVNGESTLFRETMDDADCAKWLLAPRGKQIGDMRDTVVVLGYQRKGEAKRDPFRAQSPQESKANEINYGPHVGTFQITVFHGQTEEQKKKAEEEKKLGKPATDPPVEPKEDRVVAAISRGLLTTDEGQPGSLAVLQRQLKKRELMTAEARGGRGLISPNAGAGQDHEVKRVEFVADPPEPVMSLIIRYYQPIKTK